MSVGDGYIVMLDVHWARIDGEISLITNIWFQLLSDFSRFTMQSLNRMGK